MTDTKWDKNSKAAIFLKEKLLSGEIDHAWTPKKAYEAFPLVFGKYTLDRFRGGFNRMKTALNGQLSPAERNCDEATMEGDYDGK